MQRKITDYQQRLKELERKRVAVENTEIVALVRTLNVKPGELSALLERLRIGAVPDFMTDPVETEECNDETDE